MVEAAARGNNAGAALATRVGQVSVVQRGCAPVSPGTSSAAKIQSSAWRLLEATGGYWRPLDASGRLFEALGCC